MILAGSNLSAVKSAGRNLNLFFEKFLLNVRSDLSACKEVLSYVNCQENRVCVRILLKDCE